MSRQGGRLFRKDQTVRTDRLEVVGSLVAPSGLNVLRSSWSGEGLSYADASDFFMFPSLLFKDS